MTSPTAAGASIGLGSSGPDNPVPVTGGASPIHYPSPSPRTDPDPPSVLAFSDVPADLSQLRFFDSASRQFDSNAETTSHAADSQPINAQQQHQVPQIAVGDLDANANSSRPSSAHHHPRKPSPGLAARLKALGFGGSRSASPPSAQQQDRDRDRVGRLPEEQIRWLEQNHQLGSTTTAVERRGRPWKGAIARIPSKQSLRNLRSAGRGGNEQESERPRLAGDEADDPITATGPELLPEIESPLPLEMDTNKYRLPDHTNGNGIKVQLETRQEHVNRESRSQSLVDVPPPVPAKDTPPLPTPAPTSESDFNPDAVSYFNPLGLQRPGSIYTLSRASFANQLAQLTSLQLPDADSLSSRVAAIPTAQAAVKALIGAAEQIRSWIAKASEVIGGLDSDDDVEWAAAGGREGLEEVESAITRFEELINLYVCAIDELQRRKDISSVSTDDLNTAVIQMEAIVSEWTKIRATLHCVKAQVEIAMEWEELWNMVLGDIQNEMDELIRLVFEMEERRHKSIMAAANGDSVDLGDLETIVEETPPQATRLQANNRFSLPVFPASPSSPSAPVISQDDSSLLALFARMQPLRASLDFLPMRLSVFDARAKQAFPTACEELEMRRDELDASYKKLEKDAESLRKELGEDRWVLVFRGAGRQAQKMYESVERSVSKLKEGVDAGMHLTNQPVMGKKIESYEAKKTHYGPAIERVLSIIDKGVKERLTVNGEILRLHAEMQTKWKDLKERISEMDVILEDIQSDKKAQQLRDSVSSMLSNDRSTLGSGVETPQSSPPSSVIMSGLGIDNLTPTAKSNKSRSASFGSHLPKPSSARRSLSATGAGGQPRKPISRLSTMSGQSTPGREGSTTPVAANRIPRPSSSLSNKPRWNGSTVGVDTGHNFKPLSLTTPSPYAKGGTTPFRSVSSLTPSSGSKLPTMRSPLGRAGSSSPIPEDTPSRSANRLSFRERLASPGPAIQQALPKTRLAAHSSLSSVSTRRASLQPPRPGDQASLGTPRPASSLAGNRRASMLPQPKSSMADIGTGRESPQSTASTNIGLRKAGSTASDTRASSKPRWRG